MCTSIVEVARAEGMRTMHEGGIAEYLTNIGIDLKEVRVVPDVEERIVAAVKSASLSSPASSHDARCSKPRDSDSTMTSCCSPSATHARQAAARW